MMFPYFSVVAILLNTGCLTIEGGILYPKETPTRERVPLSGLWNFWLDNNDTLPADSIRDLNYMPVPASYNDIATSKAIRDYVGVVWYEREFFIPKSWSDGRLVWIRFGSVSYSANVTINEQFVATHSIGHLPFQVEISEVLNFGNKNVIKVACDNTLTNSTVPQGSISVLPSGRIKQSYTFDFFNYAGIDRDVYLYTTPNTFVDDVTVHTSYTDNNQASISYDISIVEPENLLCKVLLFDKSQTQIVAQANNEASNCTGALTVANPNLWWPYHMSKNPGYLYSLEVHVVDENDTLIDQYSQKIGIRTLKWSNTTFLINGRPLYLYGFGRHEDSDIKGKGLDLSLIVKDHNLIKWIGANAYRTSHYPYAEEILDLADEIGIMIIDECPSVNAEGFSDELLANHKQSLTEVVRRDKNRPSVIMWSVANEPRTQNTGATDYFEAVVKHLKTLDVSRPCTIVEFQSSPENVGSSKFVDIISFNKYNGWYVDPGDTDVIVDNVIAEATAWHEIFNKPVIHQEYGSDTMEGYHSLPEFIWSEEYQTELMSKQFKAFDLLRQKNFFIGEFIWNFADFRTSQDIRRVGSNKKGVFTRNRQPKASAHLLRKRYWKLSQLIYNDTLPADLYPYEASDPDDRDHDEL